MEKITQYKASDGRIFSDETKCLQYEADVVQINEIMSQLKPRVEDDGCSFTNGGGYIQQTKQAHDGVYKGLYKIGTKLFGFPHLGMMGRCADDSDHRAFSAAYTRYICIDEQHKEWGQPYYAINPGKGVQKEL